MTDLPSDPFLPGDPRYREAPLAEEIHEGGQLLAAFINTISASSLLDALQKADRRDVERVALFAAAVQVQDVLSTQTNEGTISREEARKRLGRWLTGPPGDGTLDDLEAS